MMKSTGMQTYWRAPVKIAGRRALHLRVIGIVAGEMILGAVCRRHLFVIYFCCFVGILLGPLSWVFKVYNTRRKSLLSRIVPVYYQK